MKKSILIGLTLATSLFGNFAIASSVTSCDGRTDIDFSDAGQNSSGNSYRVACHQTDKWQRLGGVEGEDRLGDSSYSTGTSDSWDGENSASTGQDDNDLNNGGSTDDGVFWSTDGGDTWTNSGELVRGEDVTFKFIMSRSIDGNHTFDELKAWVDWNQTGYFWNDPNANEIVEHSQWYKYEDASGNDIADKQAGKSNSFWSNANNTTKRQECSNKGLTFNTASGFCNSDDDYRVFETTVTVPLNAVLGDTWLRARVVCSNSLSNHATGMDMKAYGYQDQGEVEDYVLKIVDKPTEPPKEVSEPAGLLVMSSALMFIAAARRRRSKAL